MILLNRERLPPVGIHSGPQNGPQKKLGRALLSRSRKRRGSPEKPNFVPKTLFRSKNKKRWKSLLHSHPARELLGEGKIAVPGRQMRLVGMF
jgi:hypothetical protein